MVVEQFGEQCIVYVFDSVVVYFDLQFLWVVIDYVELVVNVVELFVQQVVVLYGEIDVLVVVFQFLVLVQVGVVLWCDLDVDVYVYVVVQCEVVEFECLVLFQVLGVVVQVFFYVGVDVYFVVEFVYWLGYVEVKFVGVGLFVQVEVFMYYEVVGGEYFDGIVFEDYCGVLCDIEKVWCEQVCVVLCVYG